jgi:hypothetical protein
MERCDPRGGSIRAFRIPGSNFHPHRAFPPRIIFTTSGRFFISPDVAMRT